MERSEPTLAPQWLRSGRHVTSFVTASDDHAPPKLANNRSFSMNMSNNELRHSAPSDRAISSHTRWSSNSNSSPNSRSYSSFRSHRQRDMDRDINKYHEKSALGNHRSRELPGTPRKHSWEIFEEEGLRHSRSMISGRSSEKWPRNLSNAGKINLADNNGQLAPVTRMDSANDRGIRPLATEERQVSPGFGRVRSPRLGTMTQGLPTATSGTTVNKSASVLADVTALTGNNNTGLSLVKQADASGPSPPFSSKSISRGLNMAETVAKGPAQTTSQLSHANQRLEELAMKQPRQMVPLKPLVAKALGPTRERNGVSSAICSSLSPNAHSKRSNTLLAVPTSASTQSPANNAASSTSERKLVGTMVEKKLSSQSKSRNDFFNLVRKKSIASTSAVTGAGCAISPPSFDKPSVSDVLTASGIPQDQDSSLSDESPRVEKSTEILGENAFKGDSYDGNNSTTKSLSKYDAILCSEEEEAAFLRSLGWEENADEGGLTEEEISAFYRDVTKYINSKLSLKVMQGVQSRFIVPLHSGIGDVGGISS